LYSQFAKGSHSDHFYECLINALIIKWPSREHRSSVSGR